MYLFWKVRVCMGVFKTDWGVGRKAREREEVEERWEEGDGQLQGRGVMSGGPGHPFVCQFEQIYYYRSG
jgi:hypothetical protein